jgi:NADPH-dependent 2,4-dienoyl-CoA reductase/sulfur reductase-like enzyme
MKTVIIGGDAAGMSAAAKLRRLNKTAEIRVYEKGSYLSYSSCGLPYSAAYEDRSIDRLIQRTPADFEASEIYPKLRHEVLKVNPGDKTVLVKNLDTGDEFFDTYDNLLIATGARPVIPEIPGIGLENVLRLKTIDDGIKLKSVLPGVNSVLIAGGGYIGVEVAETLASVGKKVTIIQRPDRLLKNFDLEISAIALKELERLGAEIKLSEQLTQIRHAGTSLEVQTDKGAYKADLVLLALGVRPATEFLDGSGIELAKNGAVIVDREMRTNVPDIYAAGDCAEIYHMVLKRNVYIPLATTANKAGRMVASNLNGGHVKFPGTLGCAAVKVGEKELARAGLSEAEAVSYGFDAKPVVVEANSVPHYYPGSEKITIKLIYERESKRILGAQAAGPKGTVLRINIFAAAIANGMTTEGLGMLDLCYAPPFSTVWDAVHVAANAAK